MSRKSPLVPPNFYHCEYLPEPHEHSTVKPDISAEQVNHLDDVYMERSRNYSPGRGILIWLVMSVAILFISIWRDALTTMRINSEEVGLLLLMTLCLFWACLIQWKNEVVVPRDLPLRFNRARQRLYAYNLDYRQWDPFSSWRVTPRVYEWSQVRAELRRINKNPYRMVILAIVKPGTNYVIERFALTYQCATEHDWAHICAYMQQGPDALQPAPPPEDHNDVPWYNLSLRLAPKVEWPADMDLESRTAP